MLTEKVHEEILRMQNFRFSTVGQALAFYTRHIPVRYKPINLIEPEARACDFDPEEIWLRTAAVLHALMRRMDNESRDALELRYGFSGDRNKQLDYSEIDKKLNLRKGRARKLLRKVLDEFERRLIAVELMEPPIE